MGSTGGGTGMGAGGLGVAWGIAGACGFGFEPHAAVTVRLIAASAGNHARTFMLVSPSRAVGERLS